MSFRTVFCPIDEKEDGYVFGWKNTDTIIVAGTCGFRSLYDAGDALSRVNSSPTGSNLPQKPLEILGTVSRQPIFSAAQVDWSDPALRPDQWTVLLYKRPKKGSMRHYSLVDLNLDMLLTIQPPGKPFASLVAQQSEQQKSLTSFVEKRRCSLQGLDPNAITQMNSSDGFMTRLKKSSLGRSFLTKSRWRNSTISASKLAAVVRFCQGSADMLCFVRTTVLHPYGFGPYVQSALDSVQQLDLRCEQIIFVLRQAWLLGRTKETTDNDLSAHYISAQNCIWLILNDIIIGSAVGIFLVDNRDNLARLVHGFVMTSSIASIRSSIAWLDNWPAGLKLNTELSRFLFLLFNALLDFSETVLQLVGQLLPVIITVIGMSGALGMTMILACLSDLISLLTVHLSVSYTIVRVAFKTQLLMANSLFNLFRGKRYNVLRQRVDDWDYDLDQLLLGTMLLTLVNFLFPTITVFYLLFALTRLGVLILQAALKIALALLNHFPLFALTLRIKDPWRLPGGIIFRPYRTRQTVQQGFVIETLPITLSRIFGQYKYLGTKLASHYSPGRLIKELVKGNPLDPIPQNSIRYTYGTSRPQQSRVN